MMWFLIGVALASSATAATFSPARIAPDQGLDALTRDAARRQVGRELFANPYATVTLGSVDVYDVFPYVETRTFQVVSDPRWNRLVFGELGRSLDAYDGRNQPLGALNDPHGLAVDASNHVYVADTGNDRVLVFLASSEFGDMTLVPQYEIRGMSRPYDVSWSDGGTPFVTGDDRLYVADTGTNRVLAYALEPAGPRLAAAIGGLGNGPGRFAGPLALTVGRAGGACTPDVFVADAHTRRIVHLRYEGGALAWIADAPSDVDVVTSLDADAWGNLYAAAPNQGLVRKFAADMVPLADLHSGLARPRSFRVPFFTVRDHRSNTVTREGRPNAVSVEQWSDATGMRLWSLGLDVAELAVVQDRSPAARFTLTDRGQVTLELADAGSGRTLVRHDAGMLEAGIHTLPLSDGDLAAVGTGDVVLRIVAASAYSGGTGATATTGFRVNGGAATLPAVAMLLGNTPNPVVGSTRIAFVLPASGGANTRLALYDPAGRAVRHFAGAFAAGRNEVVWDGAGDGGTRLAPGVYFVRLAAGAAERSRRLVLVR